MTDETTTRDRAWRRAVELASAAVDAECECEQSAVRKAIDILLDNPEVLRALAGGPTADVAATHRPDRASDVAAWLRCKRDEQLTRTDPWYVLDNLLDDYRLLADTGTPLLVAAPEGVDAAVRPSADQVRGAVDWVLYFYGRPRSAWSAEEDQSAAAERILGESLARDLIGAVKARAVAEGVDAADEPDASRCPTCEKPLRRCCYTCPDGAHEDLCDGVDAADELAEAERRIRHNANAPGQGRKFEDERLVMAEYDRRGGAEEQALEELRLLRESLELARGNAAGFAKERDAARARIDAAFSAFEAAGYDLSENDGDLVDLVAELAAEHDAARAEVQQLRRALTDESAHVERLLTALREANREIEQLCARDEVGKTAGGRAS